MLDIREGDVLVVAGVEYPIRACEGWAWGLRGQAMRRLCAVQAWTKRSPLVAGGKRGAPVMHLGDVRCTPLDPVDANVAQRLGLATPHELLQTTADGGNYFYVLVVEELKR
jgi:hypothetical protein